MECKIESGSLFKAAKSKYPMYPHIEEKIRFDDYGEFIRQENYFLIDNVYEKEAVQKSYGGGGGGMGRGRGKYMQNNNDHHSQHHSHSQHQGGILTSTASAATEIEIQLPTKCISHLQKFDVQASIVWIDFEGRSDGESIQKILEHMKPRRLIITRGAEEAVRNLRSVAQVVTPETSIYSPSLREILDVTTESCIYQLKLKDALVSSLEFQKGKDAELAWVEGWLVMESELATAQEKKQQQKTPALMETDGNQDIVETDDSYDDNLFPVLEPMLTDPSPHGTVFVNEIKLSDFKQVLARQGMSSEFSGGVLWCAGGTVALRRQDAGRLTVEGSLSDDFYRIRTLLYDQYAII
jgi:cleavage and polyadenylation specificity factor subunit 2